MSSHPTKLTEDNQATGTGSNARDHESRVRGQLQSLQSIVTMPRNSLSCTGSDSMPCTAA